MFDGEEMRAHPPLHGGQRGRELRGGASEGAIVVLILGPREVLRELVQPYGVAELAPPLIDIAIEESIEERLIGDYVGRLKDRDVVLLRR